MLPQVTREYTNGSSVYNGHIRNTANHKNGKESNDQYWIADKKYQDPSYSRWK
jgi:hypothetical protein